MLESVQRKATKMVIPLSNHDLLELCLPLLEQRRMRGDHKETYKIFNHHYNMTNIESMFTMNAQLRGRHSMKLSKLH